MFKHQPWRFGFLYKYGVRSSIPKNFCYTRPVDCPELGTQVHFSTCLRCDRHQIWDPKDEIKRCWYEYKDLKSRGYYDGTWDDHPENFDPETFQKIQEEKRLNEEILRKMEAERPELERMAEELKREELERWKSAVKRGREEDMEVRITSADIEEEGLQGDDQTTGEESMEEEDYEYHEEEDEEEEEY
jgi:hypothetical protein